MNYYDEKMELPHGFQIKTVVPKDTRILTPDGKKIFKNPEPIGYVAPKGYSKFTVRD